MAATYILKVICGVRFMKNNFYRVTQLESNLWAIEDIKSSEHTVCYLICGSEKAILFDTGLGLSPLKPVVAKLTDLPVTVVLSHWHFDHCGAAFEFKNVIGWRSKNMQEISQQGATSTEIKKLVGAAFTENPATQPFPDIQLISSEQTINIGGMTLEIIHTPGHTEDSICMYEPVNGWLFTGDTAYAGPIYLHFDDSNVAEYSNSIRKLISYEVASVFPGHNAVRLSTQILHELEHL